MNEQKPILTGQTDWARLAAMTDEDIDLSDIPEITAEQFARAKPLGQLLAEKGIQYEFPKGSTITVVEEHEDGTSTTYVVPRSKPVYLDPRVEKYFPTSEAVNRALLGLIALIPEKVAAS